MFQRIVVRIWGRTILHKQDADLPNEIEQAFSTMPCSGDNVQPNQETTESQCQTTIIDTPDKRIVSEKCLVWSEEEYMTGDSMMPAMCQACKSDITVMKGEGSNDSSWVTSETHMTSAACVTSKGDKEKIAMINMEILQYCYRQLLFAKCKRNNKSLGQYSIIWLFCWKEKTYRVLT